MDTRPDVRERQAGLRLAPLNVTGDFSVRWRAPLLLLAFISLFAGVAAGLARLGWLFAGPAQSLSAMHGPLMVSGFFGTVIALERAVALSRRWAYLAPLLAGLGGAFAMLGGSEQLAALLFAAGGAVLSAASFVIYRQQRELFTLTLVLGAACWLLGNLAWLAGAPVSATVPWSIAFFVLTIAGERLELSRLLPPSPVAKRVFAALMLGMLVAVTASTFAWSEGTLVLGACLLGVALWLARQDVARRTVRGKGLTRFIAVCLLSGYLWLAASGLTILASGGLGYGGAAYDAALHAVLLGFVFSMVFGHAPIIFPAVLRVAVPYSPYFYAPLALLHASLIIRLAGDWMGSTDWRAWGGILNGVALLAFVLGMIAAVMRGRAAPGPTRAPGT